MSRFSGQSSAPGASFIPESRRSEIEGSGQGAEEPIAWTVANNDEPLFALRVLQQPERARNCGFGDRDRRLLTPPVIVQLLVRNAKNGEEIPAELANFPMPIGPGCDADGKDLLPSSEVDVSFFILNADLWDANRENEMNIVMHPAFSSADSAARSAGAGASTSSGAQSSPGRSNQPPPAGWAGPLARPLARVLPPDPTSPPPISSLTSGVPHFGGSGSGSQPAGYQPPQPPPQAPTGPSHELTYTRNLIGALAQSAYKLNDLNNKPGIFFVFHDLSIRTEGWFSLRLTFASIESIAMGFRTETAVPTLAQEFTKAFQVFSAKKFPGMKEPTELSKHFQNQGVRIPTRTTYRRPRNEGETPSSGPTAPEGEGESEEEEEEV